MVLHNPIFFIKPAGIKTLNIQNTKKIKLALLLTNLTDEEFLKQFHIPNIPSLICSTKFPRKLIKNKYRN